MSKWKRTGGGCLMTGAGDFPCDDVFENAATGKVVVLQCTREAHGRMPSETEDLRAVCRQPGVQVVRDDA